MRNINLRYIDETYDENGLLETYKVHYPDNFNFGYDIVDDIAINDPDRRAMVWCDDKGNEEFWESTRRYSRRRRSTAALAPRPSSASQSHVSGQYSCTR